MGIQRLLTLREWSPTELTLHPDELGELQAVGADVTVQPRGPGRYVVQPGSMVGTITTPRLRLLIEPKFTVERIFWMLGYTHRIRFLRTAAQLGSEANLTEGFVSVFLAILRQRLRRGLLMGYLTVEESLHGMRGRLRTADQLRRRFALALPMEVAYDDYTEDIAENRLIKAALRRLEALRLDSPVLRTRLAEALGAFGVVTDLRYAKQQLPNFSYTRLNEHYRPLLDLSALIIENSSLELREGRFAAAGLLFDMNKVFEDFVFAALGHRLRPALAPNDRWLQGRSVGLDTGGNLNPEPDLSWWRGHDCLFVGDAKYKATKAGVPDDLYQLLAYCTATGLDSGLLVYAVQPVGSITHQIVRGGPQLTVAALDLDAPLDTVAARLDELAASIAAAASSRYTAVAELPAA